MNLGQILTTYVSPIALTLTLFVLIRYTFATIGLKKAAVKQNELSFMPCIILEKQLAGNGVNFKNVGNSPALNISIEQNELLDKKGELIAKFTFQKLYLLEQNKEHPVGIYSDIIEKDIKAMTEVFGNILNFPFLPKEIPILDSLQLIIHYNNIRNVKFQTKINVKVKEKKFEVVDFRKIDK